MKQTDKKKYSIPQTEVCDSYLQSLMINIGSGETTPEESDANLNIFDDEEDDGHPYVNVWDNL